MPQSTFSLQHVWFSGRLQITDDVYNCRILGGPALNGLSLTVRVSVGEQFCLNVAIGKRKEESLFPLLRFLSFRFSDPSKTRSISLLFSFLNNIYNTFFFLFFWFEFSKVCSQCTYLDNKKWMSNFCLRALSFVFTVGCLLGLFCLCVCVCVFYAWSLNFRYEFDQCECRVVVFDLACWFSGMWFGDLGIRGWLPETPNHLRYVYTSVSLQCDSEIATSFPFSDERIHTAHADIRAH